MDYYSPFEPKQKRPTMLTVLPILTFIGSGFSFIMYFFLSFATPFIPAAIELLESVNQPDMVIQLYRDMLEIPGWNFGLMAACYALAIVGAAMMMKLRKVGYHLYIISQIALFCVSNLIIGGSFGMNFISIAWSVLFIVLYGLNYKYMNEKKEESKPFDDIERWKIDKNDNNS